jgi:hypothetical protein
LVTGKILLITEQGQVETLSRRELLRRWLDEDWSFDQSCLPAIADRVITATARDLSSYAKEELHQAEERFAYIAPFVDQRRVTNADFTDHAKVLSYARSSRTPCLKTLRRWLVRYKIGRDITALIDRKSARGLDSRPEVERLFE